MHYIYFIHGIGKHSENWIEDEDMETTLKDKIKEVCGLYSSLKTDNTEVFDKLQLVPVHYDDVYSKLYNNWADQVKTLKEHMASAELTHPDIENLLEHAGDFQQGDEDFLYTHLYDVLWFWANDSIRGKIVTHVADQIFSHIKDHYEDASNSFSIVAHSMGTAVIHQVLQDLYTDQKYFPNLSSAFKFKLFMQVSNTSYVLSRDRRKHYDTVVKPSVYADAGVCRYMVNVSHKYDPISGLIPFEPELDSWLDDASSDPSLKVYTDIQTSKLSNSNIHSIVHYFDNPKVQWAFLESVLAPNITEEEKAKAWQNFVAKTPDGQFKAVKRAYKKMMADTNIDSIASFFKTGQKLVKYIKSFS